MLEKTTISPLMATVLLIAFSVALGAVVMKWGETYIEENAEFVRGVREVVTSCDSASFSLVQSEGQPKICQQNGKLLVWFDNGPHVELSNIMARVLGEKNVAVQYVLESPLQKSGAAKTEIGLEKTGKATQVKFTPEITINGDAVQCTEKAVVVERIPNC